MRKIFSIFVFLLSSAIYLLSSNDYLMKRIAAYRYEWASPMGSDRYTFGDLYGFSYLKDYRIKIEKKPPVISQCQKPGNINLYMICDSYLWSFVKTDSIFCGVDKLKYARWKYDEQIDEKLDTSKKNILIIEVSERLSRKLLIDTVEMYTSMRVYKGSPSTSYPKKLETLWEKIQRYLFNKRINENIEFNIFDYSFLTPIREFRAELNYKIFERPNKDVSVSKDKKYLFYSATTDSSKSTSSFNFLSDDEISNIVYCVNNAYRHFKVIGFDEIYLSIIPNPVTILEPTYGKYNNLINRIQERRDLLPPLINVYPLIDSSSSENYYKSDTHWNYDGFQIWVDETNRILKMY